MASTFSAPSASGPGSGMNAGRKGNMSQRFDFRNEPPAKAPVSSSIYDLQSNAFADQAVCLIETDICTTACHRGDSFDGC